ncbi:glycerol-3-phosphate 1-O-acyltransferase PlsY [Rhizobium lentis]|uniref:Glycerol-3-phosphate acyltransferase n=1 Tax=Rhizobium lentis TaxID=1138194 RepID=A0A7W8XIY7_9HYPH|nr:glycerol-3-phosphate 1-O-acyltransferase PlsY [Rhizobium lentis]MBB5553287.1 glycerol-3-phosphate acyltransferase PlsY [Rhizobium lentis]MBB5563681.1 glycerol-3-phosphate acyltransferase PlsY [Rhizobium lentis]MBB5570214.1 glycerol-3-phosphate acyltransferase PlsY [Rhizobium lentis]
MFWIASAIGLLTAYLLGSIPTGYLLGKFLRNIDIREHGSKSTGATNALRILGKGPALFVLIVDVLKGAAAVLFALWYYPWLANKPHLTPPANSDLHSLVPWLVCFSGLAVLVGHGCSIWLKFTGGKSAATGLGVLFAISPLVGIGAAIVWAGTLAIFRVVSFSSILAAVAAIALVLSFDHPLPYRLLVIAGGLYVIIRHRANVRRLIAGVEPRLGQANSERT